MIKVGVIGTGYWGKQHLRLLSKLKCNLVGIADLDETKRDLAREYGLLFFSDYRKLIEKVDAVTVVTPPATHYEIAKFALENNCHVLLEKPFVTSLDQAKSLDSLAKDKKLICMAGHTFLYHETIKKIKEILDKKELGDLYYLVFQWLNLGIVRRDVNALWNFAPHPFSILYYFFNSLPDKISAVGNSYIQKGIEDVVFIRCMYNKTIVEIILSWLHPTKVREISIVGSDKLMVFNDVAIATKLQIQHKGLSPVKGSEKNVWKSFSEFQDKIKSGKIESLDFEKNEPLEIELDSFIKTAERGSKVTNPTADAIPVMKMLEAATKSLTKEGGWVEIGQ